MSAHGSIQEPLARYLNMPAELTTSDAAQLSRWIKWLLSREGCPWHELDDTAQDAWVRISGHVYELRHAGVQLSYLWRLVCNVEHDRRKRATTIKRTPATAGVERACQTPTGEDAPRATAWGWHTVSTSPGDTLAHCSAAGVEAALYEAEVLDMLTVRERAVTARTLEGYTADDMARQDHINPNAVYRIRRRARRRLEGTWITVT